MGEWVAVAKTSDILPGSAKVVEVANHRIAIFNVNGAFYAIDDTCSHEEASLAEGEVEDTVVECPRHGAKFDLKTGKNLSLPAVFPVASYKIKIDGETLYLEI
ncbi:MAG: non-heme iron oxygenase ferredoxin subunit [Calditrichaeota bacterium]|nr:MAG: non-heme iron oxygenase ferredoxin subunit [Calditrichota bacterium]